jgi:TonB family protein
MSFRSRSAASFAAILLALATAPSARAQQRDLEARLRQEYRGKVVTLRRFYAASLLHFSSSGALQNYSEQGPWTLWSRLRVSGLRLEPQRLEVDATRVFIHFEQHRHKPPTLKQIVTDQPVELVVDLDPPHRAEPALRQLLSQVFVTPNEDFVQLVPSYWQPFLRGQMNDQTHWPLLLENRNGGESAGGGDSAPHPRINAITAQAQVISQSKPVYPYLARHYHVHGAVVLVALIGADGRVADVAVDQPVGMGCEEAAIEAARTWTYRPYTVSGRPVPVETRITVNFSLRG